MHGKYRKQPLKSKNLYFGTQKVLTGSERNRPQNDEKGSFFDFSNEYGFVGGVKKQPKNQEKTKNRSNFKPKWPQKLKIRPGSSESLARTPCGRYQASEVHIWSLGAHNGSWAGTVFQGGFARKNPKKHEAHQKSPSEGCRGARGLKISWRCCPSIEGWIHNKLPPFHKCPESI